MKKLLRLTGLAVFAGANLAFAGDFTRAPGYKYDAQGNVKSSQGSMILTNLRVDVNDKTKQLHLISTNNDPDVITKTYILKHADPYEIRPYLLAAVKAQRIDSSTTNVECIKYNDGTGAVIISAEDYRFNKQDGVMGFDEMISILDRPNISSAPGTEVYIYFPKYWDANSLANVVRNVGLNCANDPVELQGGADKVMVDTGLNAIVFYTPAYNKKTIEEMLKLYDTPTGEVKINYSIYELDTENDGKLGVDYQAWKNGPGADIFSTAGRFTRGWTGGASDGVIDATGWNNTQFIKFSPRWNTRYFDFLTAKGKARVVTTGQMSIMNNTPATITSFTSIPRFDNSNKIPDQTVGVSYFTLENADFYKNGTPAGPACLDGYMITATDSTGKPIYTNNFTGNVSFTRLNYANSVTTYQIKIFRGAGVFYKDGKQSYSSKMTCYNLVVSQCTLTSTVVGADPIDDTPIYDNVYSWTPIDNWRAGDLTIRKGYSTETVGQNYGFEMTITPVINELSTMLNINATNTSLIGFAADGSARTEVSSLNTQVLLSNSGQKFVIGGIEKKSLVKSVSKVPWLGDLPIVGYALSSESESVKKTEMVAVLECTLTTPDIKVADGVLEDMKKVDEKTANNDENNNLKNCNFGFDQFILDKDKKSLDPLP